MLGFISTKTWFPFQQDNYDATKLNGKLLPYLLFYLKAFISNANRFTAITVTACFSNVICDFQTPNPVDV